MIEIRNPLAERARIVKDMEELLKLPFGVLLEENRATADKTLVPIRTFVVTTGSGDAKDGYIVVSLDPEGRWLQIDEEQGIFLPGGHQPTFPLTEVTDGTTIVISGRNPKE